ncbi:MULTISPECIES: GntR family transcriptional regulator [Ensifer]|uniref:UTRA domain-containing protein n=1 Tax=Ensifer canadensis TaxID=555315 RepID=A0AAW4FMW0_9HYPH|nr:MULTISPECIES: GntR family transcriptional regulator [Ensifer]KQW34832.1 GntR family transcriptional regulator [Ensifer sp. Root1252]KQW55677.1 GntR family transcriptional regulator [Ensifer sp. Root127]KQY76920.1 GntR family transcriptional regulator [Ensifer sp. Root142]KRC57156.1 GntR family transcriptional regulator [Ensifer sp. Root231]KRC87651.1 GntR family transcriptional regulator [Ensifer sp. Root258]
MQEPLRDSRTLAIQLRDRIADLIRLEGLKPGDKLPTEAQLTQRFKISRPALREALKLLEQDDVIYVEHGRGRFVSALAAVQVDRPITVFESVTDMAHHYGYTTVNKVLSISEETPDARVADSLHLPPTGRVIRIERIRLHEDEPILYCIDYVPRSIIPAKLYDLDWSGSLMDLLEECGSRPRMSAASVSSVMLPDDVVARHDLRDFGPALLITETCFNAAGIPVNYAIDYHRGSHFSFSLMRK